MGKLRGHVLIVDDMTDSLDALARILRKEGLAIETATDGREALDKVRNGAYDVILLDVCMPVMDGLECLRHLKADPLSRDIPVIMLSAVKEAQSVRDCIELGADDFLPKPIDALLLRARLASSLRKKEFRDKERNYLHRIEAANEELHRLNQLKSRILAIAAHDLKNPMTTVTLLMDQILESAQEGISPAQLKRSGERVQESMHKMLGILQALLDAAAFEAGQFVIRKQPTDLGALAQAVLEENRPYGASKSILLQCVMPTEGSWVSIVDETRIREAFDNLVSNAIKFSPPHTEVQVVVEQRLVGASKRFVLKVVDQGPGLTAEDKTQVFGIYQRLSARPTAGEVSTGLGLSIVKQMIELHQGSVWVDSEAGKGATFGIELPLEKDALAL